MCTQLNIILVTSFAFVSVALGVKWIGQAYVEYKLAQVGMIVERFDKKYFDKAMEDEDDNNTTG
mgnify:CR=1 FL=1